MSAKKAQEAPDGMVSDDEDEATREPKGETRKKSKKEDDGGEIAEVSLDDVRE